MTGKVVALFLQDAHGERPRAVSQARALLEQGLEGDLHGKRHPGNPRQVLLVDAGDLAPLGLQPGDLREQITVDMPDLMSLPWGAQLEVGEAVLEISGECEPCSRIGVLLDHPDRAAFRWSLEGHRGMLAGVVQLHGLGRIAVGDQVRVLEPTQTS